MIIAQHVYISWRTYNQDHQIVLTSVLIQTPVQLFKKVSTRGYNHSNLQKTTFKIMQPNYIQLVTYLLQSHYQIGWGFHGTLRQGHKRQIFNWIKVKKKNPNVYVDFMLMHNRAMRSRNTSERSTILSLCTIRTFVCITEDDK